MASNSDFDPDSSRRYGKPYTGKHPIPTIQGYREHRAELKERLQETENAQDEEDEQSDSRAKRAFESVKAIVKDEDKPQSHHDPYPAVSRNNADRPRRENGNDPLYQTSKAEDGDGDGTPEDNGKQEDNGKSATETAAGHIDPKQKRKDMKKIKRTGGGREVTDPVTHLPVTIHDMTDKDLDHSPENEPTPGSHARTLTGLSGASKTREQLGSETDEIERYHAGMLKVFPPPSLADTRDEMTSTYRLALMAGLGSISVLVTLALTLIAYMHTGSSQVVSTQSSWMNKTVTEPRVSRSWLAVILVLVTSGGMGVAIVSGVSAWLDKKLNDVFDDEVWDAARQEEMKTNESGLELPESVAWLNSLFASVWPLINPDLFASLVDTLEDVMQASLPSLVRMVSVDDIGQGNEAIRILGVRWLPTGAASQSVDAEGKLKQAVPNQSDRTDSGDGQIDHDTADSGVPNNGNSKQNEQELKTREQEQQAVREGMEAEEGDFVNMEIAFAYRARSTGKSIRSKAKNAHLYLKFYLPGGIAVPVWVELRGIVGIMRLRLQLTPDPPFFSLCTLTFLGQPRANLSCVPLSKHSLNLMNLPLISSFVQSAIDAALAEYVAPKSLTLDLKDMLIGDDFKKDTISRGVVWVYIRQARGFKEGDGGIGPMSGSSDSYVTLSWGKFGKPVASTRIIEAEQQPDWHEWHSILVSMDEINAEEKLRVQLWDSDKFTADDDLGRVELDLKELMHDSKTKNRMCEREDGFVGEDPDEKMPGTLTWSVGYFAKSRIQQSQLDKQTINTQIRTMDEMKKHVSETAQHKLREATTKDESRELNQQKIEDFRELEDMMMASAPPPEGSYSGIFSIQIHNITGLQVARLNKMEKSGQQQDHEDEAEMSENTPDSYCTIVLNHRKIYRTRTKPKNSKPFFNAGTERFVKDWRTAEVMISVRDSRERENDPLLGMIYLPLGKVFEKRSQVMQTFPLAGGMGYGRARVSMVWRSVELNLPLELSGWDYGTLEVKAPIHVDDNGGALSQLKASRIKLRSGLGKASLRPRDADHGKEWWPSRKRDDGSVFLPIQNRYQTALVLEFRKPSLTSESTPAFAILWLHNIPDEEDKTVSVHVWKGGKENLKRAETCCDYQGLEQDEQSLGEIQLSLKFWRGLSGYHMRHANKSSNGDVRNVMECLDTISDEKMGYEYDEGSSSSSSSSSDSDSDDEGGVSNASRKREVGSPEDVETRKKLQSFRQKEDHDSAAEDDGGNKITKPAKKIGSLAEKLKEGMSSLVDVHKDGEDDGSRGLRGQVQDYKDHRKQLHRKHRGVMQWRSARTLDWIKGKAKRATGRVEGVFEHSEKGQGIETEV